MDKQLIIAVIIFSCLAVPVTSVGAWIAGKKEQYGWMWFFITLAVYNFITAIQFLTYIK